MQATGVGASRPAVSPCFANHCPIVERKVRILEGDNQDNSPTGTTNEVDNGDQSTAVG